VAGGTTKNPDALSQREAIHLALATKQAVVGGGLRRMSNETL
jgi:hypothetical protein